MQLAQKAKSVDSCQGLATPDQRNGCIFAVTLVNAEDAKDPNKCETLSWATIDQCKSEVYKMIAVTEKDTSLCDPLKTLNGESGSTASATPTVYDQCVFSVVMSNTLIQMSDCDKVVDPNMKEMCVNSVKQHTPPTPATSSEKAKTHSK